MIQLDLLSYTPPVTYPQAPAPGKTAESRDAAAKIISGHHALQMIVLREIKRQPGTWKEVAARLGENSRNIQPRFSELKALGLIRHSGQRRDGCAVMEVCDGSEAE